LGQGFIEELFAGAIIRGKLCPKIIALKNPVPVNRNE
jgi:hypothetical protein